MITSNYSDICGWSNLKTVKTNQFYPKNIEEILNIVNLSIINKKKIAIRGNGCSFGDQSYLENEISINLSHYNKIIEYNKNEKYIVVQSGVSLLEIYNHIINDNLILECTPGGLQVSVGGAIANNIHGKDCFKNGYFKNNVISLKLINPKGELIEYTNLSNKKEFINLFGSMGLLSIVTEVKLKLKNIQSLLLDTETKKVKNIDEMLDCFKENNLNGYNYAVGWIDCFSTKNIGRGIFRKAKFSQNKKKIKINKMKQNKKFLFFPKKFMITFLSFFYARFFFKFLNFLIYNFYFKKNKKIIFNKFIWIDNNFIPDYPLIFAKDGFLTIQPFIPIKDASQNIEKILLLCQKFKFEGIFCPIKKYKKHDDDNFFSFGGNGFSIVIDVPLKNKSKYHLEKFLDEIIDLISSFRGNVYLTKDFYLHKRHLQKILYKYESFLKFKKEYDKDGLFSTNQYERLFHSK